MCNTARVQRAEPGWSRWCLKADVDHHQSITITSPTTITAIFTTTITVNCVMRSLAIWQHWKSIDCTTKLRQRQDEDQSLNGISIIQSEKRFNVASVASVTVKRSSWMCTWWSVIRLIWRLSWFCKTASENFNLFVQIQKTVQCFTQLLFIWLVAEV